MLEPQTKRPIANFQAVVDRSASAVRSTAYAGSCVDDCGPGASRLGLLLAVLAVAALVLVVGFIAVIARGR